MHANTRPATPPQPQEAATTVLYVWAFDPSEAPGLLRSCQRWAEKHRWPVLDTLVDTGALTPLHQRPGWAQVRRYTASGTVERVVTLWTSLTSSMHGEAEMEISDLACRGVRVEYANGVGASAAGGEEG